MQKQVDSWFKKTNLFRGRILKQVESWGGLVICTALDGNNFTTDYQKISLPHFLRLNNYCIFGNFQSGRYTYSTTDDDVQGPPLTISRVEAWLCRRLDLPKRIVLTGRRRLFAPLRTAWVCGSRLDGVWNPPRIPSSLARWTTTWWDRRDLSISCRNVASMNHRFNTYQGYNG